MTVSSASAATGAIVTNSATTPSSGAASGGGTDIAGNFQQFLTLLTTQLKNQSPLDPLDTNQFTQQLVQFASVEQQLKTNATLTTLTNNAKAGTASSAAGLVGATVTADGASATFADGAATWTLTAPKAAASATINISDTTGKVVASRTQPLVAGPQTYAWDGRTLSGTNVANGTFQITVSARDAAGQPVSVASDQQGTVTSVDLSGDSPTLLLGTTRVPLSSVKSIGH